MSSSSNLKLNLMFLITIFRLDLMSKTTMAKPQEQIVSGETVLVRDSDPISSTTVVYLDESSMSAYSATSTIDTNNYQLDNHQLDNQLNNRPENYEPNNDLNGNRSPSILNDLKAAKKEPRNEDVKNEETVDTRNHQSDHQVDSKSMPGLNATSVKPLLTIGRQMNRDEWLAKEYFSYLCASEHCVNGETRRRIQTDCFAKHVQLKQVMSKCNLINGRCEQHMKSLNCVLSESRKNDHLYTINNKEMLDAAVKDDAKGQKNLKLNLFQPKIDVKNNPLSWRTKFGFSLGHFFNDAVSSVWFCYSLLYFKLFFSNTMAGCLVLVGQVADAVITPIIGFYCDRQKCTPDSWFLLRAGKRKFWHIIGTLLLMIVFPLSYTYPLLLENGGEILRTFSIHTVVYVIIIALFQGAWAKVQVSHVSLITDLTSLQNERVALNAYRQAATVLANLFIYVLMLLLLRGSSDDNSAFSKKDAKFVAIASGIACCVGAIVTTVFYVLVKEPGQCFLNKHKRMMDKAASLQPCVKPSHLGIEKGLELSGPVALPEILNGHVVGSTENSDYVPGVWKQTSINDITPYYYPNFYYYSTALKTISQSDEPELPISTLPTPPVGLPVHPSNLVNNLVSSLNERPKLMASVSIDTTASDLADGKPYFYKKKVGEMEKKKSKLSLKNMAVPVKRMFSVDARRQFNCKDWLTCFTFYKVGFIYMFARLYFNTTQAYTTLYLTYTLKLNKSSIAIVPFVVYISGFVISLLARPISAKIGSRYVLLIGCIFSIVSCTWFNFGDETNESFKQWQVYGATVFNGIGCTSILISSMAITTDLIGDNKNSGFVFASMSFLDKLINGLTVYLIELFNPEVPQYYQFVLVYAAGAAVLFTLVGLFSIRSSSLGKLDNKSSDSMLKELVQQSTPPIH